MKAKTCKELLERLDLAGARALEAAAGLAVTRGHHEVGVEHLALKLLEEETGDFGRLLSRCGLDLDAWRRDLLEHLAGLPADNRSKPGFSRLLWQWLERAWLAGSLHRQSPLVAAVDLLAGLSEMLPFLPGQAFTPLLTLPLDGWRHQAVRTDAGATPLSAAAKEEGGATAALARFTIDLTARAAAGEIDPVLGRSGEIRQLMDILTRRRKNNPILVGEPGVGKTAIVEGLARRIAAGDVPEPLRAVRLLVLDLGLLQAGAGVKGEFEKRLKEVIEEVRVSLQPVVLFIDEAHTLVGAGGEAGQSDAANLLKPALARGELRTIAATTWAEYKKYFERDAALARRFQPVKVEEPDEAAAIGMLSGLKELYQRHHQVLISDAALAAAVRLSARYIAGRQLPDKAIDLLDTAAARVRMGQSATPAAIDAGRERIAGLEGRLAHLEADRRHGLAIEERLAVSLATKLAAAQTELSALTAKWQQEQALAAALGTGDGDELRQRRDELRQAQGDTPLVQAEVNAAAVAEVVAEWTGIPVGRMLRDDLAVLVDLEDHLDARLIGQRPAMAALASAIRTAKAGLRQPQAPLGVFLLAGPSGVGKTETARALAELLFGGERFLVTINLSEYQEAHTVSQLKGSPPGYVGYGEGGVLTEAVRQRPYSVLLLDEAEKAHPEVMSLFYQVFDRGVMRDGAGREIDFRNSIIVLTTNLGAEAITLLAAEADNGQPSYGELLQALQPAVQRHFAPALAARMQTVPFFPLDGEALQAIVALKLDALAGRLAAAHNLALHCSPDLLALLAERCRCSATGARQVQAVIEQQLLPGIARQLLQFMADGEMPAVLRLEPDVDGGIACLFLDTVDEAAAGCTGGGLRRSA